MLLRRGRGKKWLKMVALLYTLTRTLSLAVEYCIELNRKTPVTVNIGGQRRRSSMTFRFSHDLDVLTELRYDKHFVIPKLKKCH